MTKLQTYVMTPKAKYITRRGLSRSEMTMDDTSLIHVFVFNKFIFYFSCWIVAVSLVAEQTHAGVAVFAALLSACLLVR